MTMRKLKILGIAFLFLLAFGFAVPEGKSIPVSNATTKDWHPKTFWFEPWGSSGVHKGIDIFARPGTPVLATTNLLILYEGKFNKGGNVVFALGPKWRIHYFAHLQETSPQSGWFKKQGQIIGSVGNSGNAVGKPAHLHYSILSLLPRPWQLDFSTQGYKKMFYLDPGKYLQS